MTKHNIKHSIYILETSKLITHKSDNWIIQQQSQDRTQECLKINTTRLTVNLTQCGNRTMQSNVVIVIRLI